LPPSCADQEGQALVVYQEPLSASSRKRLCVWGVSATRTHQQVAAGHSLIYQAKIDWSGVIEKVIGGLIVAAILAIVGWAKSPRFRLFLKRLWNTVSEWLGRQWRYLVVVAVLLIPIYVVLYLVYASWWIIALSIVHFALVTFATPPLLAPKRPWTIRDLIQRIDFDYPLEESPFENGWRLVEGAQPTFEYPTDDSFGKVIAIREVARSERPYALDYNVEPDARRLGKMVEFVAELKPGAAIYARVVNVLSKARSTSTEGWIQFQIGTSQPQKVAYNEWVMCVMPTQLKGNWQLFRIDLIDAVNQTFGNDGWSFKKLIGFRLRGNLELAYISVLKS
jgi:hypothetical protein